MAAPSSSTSPAMLLQLAGNVATELAEVRAGTCAGVPSAGWMAELWIYHQKHDNIVGELWLCWDPIRRLPKKRETSVMFRSFGIQSAFRGYWEPIAAPDPGLRATFSYDGRNPCGRKFATLWFGTGPGACFGTLSGVDYAWRSVDILSRSRFFCDDDGAWKPRPVEVVVVE